MTNLGKHTKSQPKWILCICSINSYTSNHFFLSVVFFVGFFWIVIFHVLLLYVCYIAYVIQSLNHLPQPGDYTVDIASHLCIVLNCTYWTHLECIYFKHTMDDIVWWQINSSVNTDNALSLFPGSHSDYFYLPYWIPWAIISKFPMCFSGFWVHT